MIEDVEFTVMVD